MQETKTKIVATKKPRKKKDFSRVYRLRAEAKALIKDKNLPYIWKDILLKHYPEYKAKHKQWWWNIFNDMSSDAKFNAILKRIINKEID